MKIITIEEHHDDPVMGDAIGKAIDNLPPSRRVHYILPASFKSDMSPAFDLSEGHFDFGERRVASMDAAGIDMQVSGCGNLGFNLQLVDAEEAVALSKQANDRFAEAVKKYPARLAGLATLPTQYPEAAAQELERAVCQLGFKGAMIPSVTNGMMLDHPDFTPLLQAANDLDVPIYIHPTVVVENVRNAYFSGIDTNIDFLLAGPGFGWHAETGICALRLIFSGSFEKYKKLRLIMGHWGEVVPYILDRTDEIMYPGITKLPRTVSEYFKEHVYVTPSGLFHKNPFEYCMREFGADNIMYSVDYPYLEQDKAREFLETAPYTEGEKKMIAHTNAEKLFRIQGTADL